MENILVPIGSSENAINTLQYAIDFVEGTNVKIYVIKVYGVAKAASSMKNIDAILQEDSDKELKAILREVNTKGVEIITKSIKGDVIDSIERAAKQLKVNLIISSTQNISTNDKVYLGRIAGGLIKSTDIPVLIVPKEYVFKKVLKVFMAIKSGIISSPNVLVPLNNVLNRFDAKLDLIRVITANSKVEDSELNKELEALKTNYKTTENATVFQGVLEFIHEVNPDMICVIRRKRGFFKRLWENERVYKKDFESRIPLLVLKGAV